MKKVKPAMEITGAGPLLIRFPGRIEPSAVSHKRARHSRAASLVFLCGCLTMFLGTGCMTWHPRWPEKSTASAPADAAGRLRS